MKSFARHLEQWRQEPEPRRERRALLLAGGLTALLFVLWLASFRLATSLRQAPVSSQSATVAQDLQAPGIIARIKTGWQTLIK